MAPTTRFLIVVGATILVQSHNICYAKEMSWWDCLNPIKAIGYAHSHNLYDPDGNPPPAGMIYNTPLNEQEHLTMWEQMNGPVDPNSTCEQSTSNDNSSDTSSVSNSSDISSNRSHSDSDISEAQSESGSNTGEDKEPVVEIPQNNDNNLKVFINEFANSIVDSSSEKGAILAGLITVNINYPDLNQEQAIKLVEELFSIPVHNEFEDALAVRAIVSITTQALINEHHLTDPLTQVQWYQANMQSMMERLSRNTT